MRIYPTPINLNIAWCFGFLSGFFLIVQLLTGLLLTMHYIADVNLAFDSLRMIMREVSFGWLLRYFHLNGASLFFLAVYLHMGKNIFYGSYLTPRYNIWLSGLLLYILLVATAFFGYVLPWGQMSYWGATVISGLISTVPIFGQFLLTIIWGGENITTITLRRFYTLHFLFPFIILIVMFIHLIFLHEEGSNNPMGFNSQDNVILHIFYSIKDLLVIYCFFALFLFFIFYLPTFLGNPVNALIADVNFTPKKMVPEWYFLPMYTILRSINSRGGGVLLLAGFFILLFSLPFLTNPLVKSGDLKLLFNYIFQIIITVFIILGWAGSKSLDDFWIFASRLFTSLFFIAFLSFLPLTEVLNERIVYYRVDYYIGKVFYLFFNLGKDFFSLHGFYHYTFFVSGDFPYYQLLMNNSDIDEYKDADSLSEDDRAEYILKFGRLYFA